jgi:mono/diheme cytochrome c family protein
VKKTAALIILGAVLSAGREFPAQTTPPPIGPLPSAVRAVFRQHCLDCHKGENPPRGLNLEPGRIAAAIEAASKEKPLLKIIDSANPNESYLLKKVRGDSDIVGSRMPFGEKALTPAKVEILKTWISGLKKDKAPAEDKNLVRGGRS